MMTINDVNPRGSIITDQRAWDALVKDVEGCTCDKPIYGIVDICGKCLPAFCGPDNPEAAIYREWVKQCEIQGKRLPMPAHMRPILQRAIGNNRMPDWVFADVPSSEPQFFKGKVWAKPHIPQFIRHLWEKLFFVFSHWRVAMTPNGKKLSHSPDKTRKDDNEK